MKKLSLCLSLLMCLSFSSLALDRTKIADKAENVTPILVGQSAPNTTLLTAEGDPVSLKALVIDKPTVVLFYRGGWCPYCNRQLAGLKDVEQTIADLGYQILAISPETPAQLLEQKLKTEFVVRLLSDSSLDTIRGFGLGFYVPEQKRQMMKSKWDIELTSDVSTSQAVLPAPAVFILDQKGIVQFSYVNPNFKTRLSPALLVQAAKLVK